MKLLIISSLILIGCAHQKDDSKVSQLEAMNDLGKESFLKWSAKSLKEQSTHQLVSDCYRGEIDKSLENFKQDFNEKSKTAYYWLHVGNCYFMKGSYTKAEFFYRMVSSDLKSKPTKAMALNNLALIAFKFEDWEKGKDYLKEAIEIGPEFKVPRFNLSQLHLQFGHYDRSIDLLTHSSFKGVKDVDVYYSLANAYLYKGDLKKAKSYFDELPESVLKREDIAATYALYLIKVGDFKEATRIMDEREKGSNKEIIAITNKIEEMLSEKNAGE